MRDTVQIELPQGYKQTKIGLIPEDWELKKLNKLGVFVRGKGLPKRVLIDEGINAIRYGEIYTSHHFYIKEFYSFISEEVANTATKLENGDILFTGSGETLEDIGKSVAFVDDNIEAYAGGDIVILRTKGKKVNPLYLGFATNNSLFQRQTYSLGQGNAVVHIYPSNLKNTKLPIPPLPEQKAIADCLSTWDKGIEKLTALIQSKKEQKKGLMQQIFSGQLKVDNGQLIQAKEGEDFTDEWKEFRLGDVLRIGSGKDYKHLDSGTIPVYGSGGLMLYVNDFLYDGDSVGIGRKGTIDKPVFLTGKFWTVDTLFYTHSFKNTIPKFIYYKFLKINWYKYNEASGVPSLSKKTIENIIINMPNVNEQNEIVKALNLAGKEIELLEKKLDRFKTQKIGLMQVLLTGEKRLLVDSL